MVHAVAPLDEKVPAWQLEQTASTTAPIATPYLPGEGGESESERKKAKQRKAKGQRLCVMNNPVHVADRSPLLSPVGTGSSRNTANTYRPHSGCKESRCRLPRRSNSAPLHNRCKSYCWLAQAGSHICRSRRPHRKPPPSLLDIVQPRNLCSSRGLSGHPRRHTWRPGSGCIRQHGRPRLRRRNALPGRACRSLNLSHLAPAGNNPRRN